MVYSRHRYCTIQVFALSLLFSLSTTLPQTGHAQFQLEYVTSVPVIIENDTLPNAWAGGLNAGQYSNIDLNRNDTLDLVVFDRTAGKLNTFLRQGETYRYAPAYEALFPANLRHWVLLADYNCDGKQDLFTSSSRGIRVFQNTSENELSFALVADPVLTEGSSGTFNLQVNSGDIPGVTDVDGDGDLDILVFDFAAGGTIEYHQNQRQETNGSCQDLLFKRITRRWGNFEECNCGVYAFGEPCAPAGGRVAQPQHVGGKSIFTVDYDGDGDQDLAFGDETCTSLAFLENEGSAEEALFLAASDTFPVAAAPADGFLFPAAYRAEATHDGVRDIIVAPNVFSNVRNSIDFTRSSWLYRNVGTATQPRFALASKDFLQGGMIDLGANAAPAFGDFDGDGDQDLLVGAEQILEQARLHLYENVGTLSNPSFRLTDDDYLNLSAENFTSLKPSLADIDGDGRIDLLLQSSGVGVGARLRYLRNQSATVWDFVLDSQDLGVNMVEFDTPFFYDLDRDGRADLLIGRVTGKLEYLRNEGGERAAFALVTDTLAGIKNDPFRRNLVPWVGDLNGDGGTELLTVDGSGVMRIYENFLDDAVLPTVTTQLIRYGEGELQESRWGARTWLSGADLFATGRTVLAVGHAQGGIYLLANTGDGPRQEPTAEKLTLTVFPNPSSGEGKVKIRVSQPAQLMIFNTLGQLLYRQARFLPEIVFRLRTDGWAKGIYLVKVVGDDRQTAVQRLVVHH